VDKEKGNTLLSSFLFVASLLGEYTGKVECSRLVDEYFGSFLFKIGDVMDEERLSFQMDHAPNQVG